jgi:hypothetical protein
MPDMIFRLSSSPDSVADGRSSLNVVEVGVVCALVSDPKVAPNRCHTRFASPSGTYSDPRNERCSMKCAKPRSLSVSFSDPASIRTRTETWPGGTPFLRTANRMPFGNVPNFHSGSRVRSLPL